MGITSDEDENEIENVATRIKKEIKKKRNDAALARWRTSKSQSSSQPQPQSQSRSQPQSKGRSYEPVELQQYISLNLDDSVITQHLPNSAYECMQDRDVILFKDEELEERRKDIIQELQKEDGNIKKYVIDDEKKLTPSSLNILLSITLSAYLSITVISILDCAYLDSYLLYCDLIDDNLFDSSVPKRIKSSCFTKIL